MTFMMVRALQTTQQTIPKGTVMRRVQQPLFPTDKGLGGPHHTTLLPTDKSPAAHTIQLTLLPTDKGLGSTHHNYFRLTKDSATRDAPLAEHSISAATERAINVNDRTVFNDDKGEQRFTVTTALASFGLIHLSTY